MALRPRQQEEPYKVNERIRVPQVRLVGENIESGVFSLKEALEIAKGAGLDLVEISPNADPPVCKVIDYSKFKYEQKKKQKEAKAKQTFITVKEIKFRPGTDEHDYEFKKNNAARLLHEGDKVKATVHFRGREITHKELGFALLQKLELDLAEAGTVEVRPKLEGMNMFIMLAPKKKESHK